MKTITYILLAAVLFNAVSICFAEEKKDDAAEMIVKGNTDFAFDLYAQLKNEDGNLFFSPYSISTALAMTYAGANGETAEQMGKTLHFMQYSFFYHTYPAQDGGIAIGAQEDVYTPIPDFHSNFGLLIDQLNQQGQKGDYQLSIANALWAQKDYTFLDPFIDLNKTHYKAGLENVDFVKETEKTRLRINQWVEDQTNEKIKDLIPQGALDAMTRLVLTNAIYFKGDWVLKFDAEATKDAPFYISSEKTVTTPLMYQKEKFKYGQTQTLQTLELPYKGDDLSMLVLLPKAKDGLAGLEKELTADNLTKWQKQMRKQEVEVFLPKFKMTSQFGLSDTLKAMGMPDAFDESKADFSGMTGKKDLFISDVIHKAFVEVNEEGTEAAAVTSTKMTMTAMPQPEKTFTMACDHPFLYAIVDHKSGAVLFLGAVFEPLL